MPAAATDVDVSSWMRSTLRVHARTEWSAREYPGFAGGRVLTLEERWGGIPIAGARLALRVQADLRLRQVVGTSLRPEVPLLAVGGAQPSPESIPDPALRWWPTPEGLVLARIERSALTWMHGAPVQALRLVEVRSGRVLAQAPGLDHAPLEISGWRENPLSTPEPQSWLVDILDGEAISLETEQFRVMQCVWDDGACAPDPYPPVLGPEHWATDPPGVDEVAAHTDPDDSWVRGQALQYASRIFAAYTDWGWDPMVWDLVDCSSQEVAPEQCKLWIWVNVLGEGEDGPQPFDGAYHWPGKGVFLGQGTHGDAGFDMQMLAHEIMHHVQRGYGNPEPTAFVDDGAFWRNDGVAINEGTSDLFARLVGESDELFQYFRNHLGLYQGPYRRDVSIPFRCPENITGEVHMEGRIWAAAWYDVHLALHDAGLAGDDSFPQIFLAALPAIRQLPVENPTQFEAASRIVLDEIALGLGSQAHDLAEELVRERGLIECSYVVDLREEPSVSGEDDPDPYDARFLMLKARAPGENPDWIAGRPHAPAVQHRITLNEDEGGVSVAFVPDVWHRTDLVDDPFDGEGLEFAALVKSGEDPIVFERDPDTNEVVNDADLRVLAKPDPERGPTWRRIDVDGLAPGTSHQIALVTVSSLTPGLRPVMQSMQWSILPAEDGDSGTGETGETGETGAEEAGETGDGAGGARDAGSGASGCACTTGADPRNEAGALLVGLGLVALRRRRGGQRVR